MLRLILKTAQLQHAFKHAKDFGIPGHPNRKTLAAFSAALRSHVEAANTVAIQGAYRGNVVTHFVNRTSCVNVICDRQGNFLSGWKLSVQQLKHVTQSGNLGGGL